MRIHRVSLAAVAFAGAILLAGCFSDDDDNDGPADSSQVSDNALASGAALAAFIGGLAATDESSEPLTFNGDQAVPADDSGEPKPLT